MRSTPHLAKTSFAIACAAALVALLGCSQDVAPETARPALQTGTVRAALSSTPSPCPAIGSCILYPDRDTTVYAAAVKDYGKSHELCAGASGGSNGVERALLHFDLGLLPAHFFATTASLSVSARRGPASASLSVFRLTAGTWDEGNGTGLADGHMVGGCSSCAGTGACGWTGNGTNNASFAVTNNVGSATTSSTFTVPGVATFGGLEGDVRTFASGPNLGWSIRGNNEGGGRPVVFWSTDTATGDANKPSLTVSYGRGPGASGCNVNSDCFFSNGATGFCAPNHVCCSAACTDSNQCTTEMCDSTGACSHPFNTNTCDDGNGCTTADTCNGAGTCVGSGVTCPAADQCHTQATCTNGSCPANPPKPNGTTCDDGNACTNGDTCQAGACTGGTAVVCTPLDQCHVAGTCTGGVCSNPTKPNGTTCDDGNTCTSGESCQNGTCTGGTGVTCPPADQCHTQATCVNGICPANPPKPNGTVCDDGNACTTGETCQAGVCTGGTGTVCTPLDQCHVAGNCSGGVCSNPTKPNGTACDDGNTCTTGETCQAGVCTGGTGTVCTPLDQCHVAGTCSGGVCSNPNKPNGTPCNDGSSCTTGEACQNGVCTGGTGTVCPPPDQCHQAATCAKSGCSYPEKPDGTPCDDGDPCMAKDVCESGVCAGTLPIPCVPPQQDPLRTRRQPAPVDAGSRSQADASDAGRGGPDAGVAVSNGPDAGASEHRASTGPSNAKDPQGCGCRVPGSREADSRGALGFVALALLAARRRRRTDAN